MTEPSLTAVVNGVPQRYDCDEHTTGRKITNAFAHAAGLRTNWELLDGSGAPVPELEPLDVATIPQPLYYQPTPGAGG